MSFLRPFDLNRARQSALTLCEIWNNCSSFSLSLIFNKCPSLMTFWVAAGTDQTSGWCYVSRELIFTTKTCVISEQKQFPIVANSLFISRLQSKRHRQALKRRDQTSLDKRTLWQQGMLWRTETGTKAVIRNVNIVMMMRSRGRPLMTAITRPI